DEFTLNDNDLCHYVGIIVDDEIEHPVNVQLIRQILIELLLGQLQHKHVLELAHLHHICMPWFSHDKVSLMPLFRMYLGGMGSTGKSQVLSSMMYFLIACQKEHRFAILGPTSGSAALINGATYHSMLGFGHQSTIGNSTSISALAKVRGQISRVETIFVDEISMVSCCDLYQISSQLTKAFCIPSEAFGGKSIIFAGDFAQLSPVGRGQSTLYSDRSSSQTMHEQQTPIGQTIWHLFTDIVILKRNMRQTGTSPLDQAFCIVLANMRYKSCSLADCHLLQS
ncbi:ATP-dependent DNA helicase pif1, partial [Grifola frondosa]